MIWQLRKYITNFEFACLVHISYFCLLLANYTIPNPDLFDYISLGNFIHKTIISLTKFIFTPNKIIENKKTKIKRAISRESIHYVTMRLIHSVRFHGPPSFYNTSKHEHHHIRHKYDIGRWGGNSKVCRSVFLQQRINLAKNVWTFFNGNPFDNKLKFTYKGNKCIQKYLYDWCKPKKEIKSFTKYLLKQSIDNYLLKFLEEKHYNNNYIIIKSYNYNDEMWKVNDTIGYYRKKNILNVIKIIQMIIIDNVLIIGGFKFG